MSERMLNRRLRHLALVATAVIGALALSSCVTIPTDGPVLTGREVSEQELAPGSEVIPEGPVEGADQEAILDGFMAAHSGSGNYDVARQFLSSSLAEEWEPRESVLIRTGNDGITRLSPNNLAYNIVVSATVDRDGMYNTYPAAAQALAFEFVKEDGEWRIDAAPDGIVLASGTFSRLFKYHTLYFLDPTNRVLVPDVRWFPAGTAATRVVSALLNGPPPWLQGAVGTSFPEGTQLSSPRRVAVQSNEAVIDFTEEALAASEAQRQLMRLQLEASLGRASITSVELTVGGTPLSISPLGPSAPQLRPQVDSRMLVLADGEFGYLANNRVAPIEGLSAKVVATNPTEVTLASTGTAAVTLGEAGVQLVQAGADNPVLIDDRSGLIAPTLDGYGYVWTVPRSDPDSIRISDLDGKQFALETTFPADAEIVSLEVARDGTRIAALFDTSAGARMIVASIIRDQNQDYLPVSLGSEPRVDRTVNNGVALDATWVDELSVATLSRIGDTTEVVSHQVGGKDKDLGSPDGAVAIVGGNTEASLRVLNADGVISTRRGSGWLSGSQVTLMATQR